MGSTKVVSFDQVRDCLDRGWIVVIPEFRLCPQVDVLSATTDVRDCLAWIHDGSLNYQLGSRILPPQGSSSDTLPFGVDTDRIAAYGMSSGAGIAGCLGFDVPNPVSAVLCLYPSVNYKHPMWSRPFGAVKQPANSSPEYMNQVYAQKPVAVDGMEHAKAPPPPAAAASPSSSSLNTSSTANSYFKGLESASSVRSEAAPPPPTLDFRTTFCLTHMAQGTLLKVCYPSHMDLRNIDPMLNVRAPRFPPTCIVHGNADTLVDIGVSREFHAALKAAGVRNEFIEVPGENHSFVITMELGGQTWQLSRRGFDFLEKVLKEKRNPMQVDSLRAKL